MGKVPNIRRILSENYPDLDWMPRLANTINVFMEQTIRLLNNNLNFADNFDGEVKEITVDGQYPLKVSWGRNQKPIAVWIGRALRLDGSEATYTSALTLKWRFNENGQIEISDVVGLDDSETAKYKLVIIGVTG